MSLERQNPNWCWVLPSRTATAGTLRDPGTLGPMSALGWKIHLSRSRGSFPSCICWKFLECLIFLNKQILSIFSPDLPYLTSNSDKLHLYSYSRAYGIYLQVFSHLTVLLIKGSISHIYQSSPKLSPYVWKKKKNKSREERKHGDRYETFSHCKLSCLAGCLGTAPADLGFSFVTGCF